MVTIATVTTSDGYYRDGYYRDDRRSMRPICTEGRALGKAERMGIRRARIADVGRRTIEVRGRDRSRRPHLCHLRPLTELPGAEPTLSLHQAHTAPGSGVGGLSRWRQPKA